jgi:hypothetical protein
MVAERWPSQSFMVGDLDAGGTKPYRARKRVPFVQNIAARVQAPQENGGNVTRPRVADDFSTIRARNARDPRSRAQRRLDTLLHRRQRP